MSGFSSVVGKYHQEQDQQTDNNNYSLFLSKNREIFNKGFQLWQHQIDHSQNIQDVDFSIGPSNNNIIIGDEPSNYYSNRSVMRGGNDGVNCQDCGNQAKKDCVHMRCRTCCKSRGFQCQTHVKSTWVPAAKRRERLQQLTTSGGENSKRARDVNLGGSGGGGGGDGRGSSLASGFESGQFPAELNSPAVFRCVRVSAMNEAEEHMAYQTAVNIGGHVFKGILYDQGPENRYPGDGGESSSAQQKRLDLIAGGGAATTTPAATSNMLEYPSVYQPQVSGFMAGTQFFLPPRP